MESIRRVKKDCNSVIITSDKSYKNLEIKRGYHENDLLGGKDPYSASKSFCRNCYSIIYTNIFKGKKIGNFSQLQEQVM